MPNHTHHNPSDRRFENEVRNHSQPFLWMDITNNCTTKVYQHCTVAIIRHTVATKAQFIILSYYLRQTQQQDGKKLGHLSSGFSLVIYTSYVSLRVHCQLMICKEEGKQGIKRLFTQLLICEQIGKQIRKDWLKIL